MAMNSILKLAFMVAICLAGHSIVIVDSCLAAGDTCDPTGILNHCCAGFCIVPSTPSEEPSDLLPFCDCTDDGDSCSSSTQCCHGKCNTRGYCGCIGSDSICNEGHDSECCKGSCNKGTLWSLGYWYCN